MADDQPEIEEPSQLRAMLEQATRERAEAQARLADLERKDTFREAGLDPTNKLHRAVINGYDGDVNVEAVRSYVSELGITDRPAQPEPPPVPQTEQDALSRIADAGAGEGTPPPAPDLRAALAQKLAQRAAQGATIAELDAISVEFSKAGGFRTINDFA